MTIDISYNSTCDHTELQNIVKSILIANANHGTTICEIRDQYHDIIGEKFPIEINNITDFVLDIKGSMCYVNDRGLRLFYLVESEKSNHILEMVRSQKSSKYLNSKNDHFNYYNNKYENYSSSNSCISNNNNKNNNNDTKTDSESKSTNENYQIESHDEKPQQLLQNEEPLLRQSQTFIKETSIKPIKKSFNILTSITSIAQRIRHSSVQTEDESDLNLEQEKCLLKKKPKKTLCYFKDNYRFRVKGQKPTINENFNPNCSWNSRKTGTSTEYCSTVDNNRQDNLINDKNKINAEKNQYIEFCNSFNVEKYKNYINNDFYNKNKYSNGNGPARLYDYQLMGDDFFLSLAKMEIGCKFKPDHKILQSGFCISGLTIKKATKLVKSLPYLNPNIIVNIGSVDILDGRDLVDIEYDFRKLKQAFLNRGIKPIITTLVPLANFGHKTEHLIIQKFNKFLKLNTDLHVIDLWPCMVNSNGHTLFECYQLEAKYVTGSNKPHVLWNKLGRQRILKKIKSEIEIMPF